MAGKNSKKQRSIQPFVEVRSEMGDGRTTSSQKSATSNPGMSPKSAAGTSLQDSTNLQAIMTEIKLFRTESNMKADRLEIKFDLMQQKLNSLDERVKETETRISTTEDQLQPLLQEVQTLKRQMSATDDKLDEIENRSRRNNVRLLGLNENAERGNLAKFAEDLIKTLFPETGFTTFFSIVRAHRIGGTRPVPGARPRALIMRFLHYRDRDILLEAVRKSGQVSYNNNTLSFYPDVSIAVQKSRKLFDTAKELLRKRKIIYAMLFPAKLRFAHRGKVYFFSDAKEACSHIERVIPLPPAPDSNAAAPVGTDGQGEPIEEI